MKTSTNKYHLKGILCPQCESMGPFYIVGLIEATIYDTGPGMIGDRIEWCDESRCSCYYCGYQATVKDFKEKKRKSSRKP